MEKREHLDIIADMPDLYPEAKSAAMLNSFFGSILTLHQVYRLQGKSPDSVYYKIAKDMLELVIEEYGMQVAIGAVQSLHEPEAMEVLGVIINEKLTCLGVYDTGLGRE